MKIKRVIAITFALFVVFALCSCGESARPYSVDSITPSNSMKNTSALAAGESYYGGDSYSSDSQVYENETSDYSRKIIKHQNLYLETLEFDKGLEDIEILVGSYGGYYASSEISTSGSTRRATLSLRIPSSKLDEFVSGITKSETFNIRSTSLSTEEVTETYYDLKAQLDSLMDQEARLNVLMDKAANLSELLTIENKLTSVRTQINSVSSKIQYYDKAVDMSFVNITLYEVKEYIPDDPPTYFERVALARPDGRGILRDDDAERPRAALPRLVAPDMPALPAVERREVRREAPLRPRHFEIPQHAEPSRDLLDDLPLEGPRARPDDEQKHKSAVVHAVPPAFASRDFSWASSSGVGALRK